MEERKSKTVVVRVTPSTYEQIVHHAKRFRKKPSTMARDMILDWLETETRAVDAQTNTAQAD